MNWYTLQHILAVLSAIVVAWIPANYLLTSLSGSGSSRTTMSDAFDFESWITTTLEPYKFIYKPHSDQVLQRLWAGYGSIHRISATSANDSHSLICKIVSPPPAKNTTPDESHLRKILSYQVEAFFYKCLAHKLPPEIAVAKYITSGTHNISGPSAWHLIITDLKPDFPVAGEKRGSLTETQIESAIDWLAGFHGFWWHANQTDSIRQLGWVEPPLQHWSEQKSLEIAKLGLWRNGGYTYLATRLTEFASLQYEGGEWCQSLCGGREIAEKVARFLAKSSNYHTLIHGDVKSENLFTSKDGKRVAFYDFQYVGRGLGVCDLAKLFTCSVPLNLLGDETGEEFGMSDGERQLLKRYKRSLEERAGKKYEFEVLLRHWETALVDWLRFQASWGFWGNTEWLEGRVRRILKDAEWLQWLEGELKT